jgi:cell division protein FtsQ
MNIQQLTKPFLFSTTLLLGGLHMSAWVSSDGAFRVQHLEVEGCQYSSESEVRAAAQALLGKRIFGVDLDSVQEAVAAMPYVMEARVSRVFPSTIQISVVEKQPFALLNDRGMLPVDAEGVLMPRLKAGAKLDLPIISGVRVARRGANARLPAGTLPLLEFMRALNEANTVLYQQISEFHVDGRMNLTLFLVRDGVPVYLGKEEWPEKCDRLQTVLKQIEMRAERVASLDLRFENQVVTKPAA